MSKPFFPHKQFGFTLATQDWELKMRTKLEVDLKDGFHHIKITGGKRIVQKDVYIDYLISEEKLKRLNEEQDSELGIRMPYM